MSLILRPYQHRAISDLRLAYRDGARAPLLVAPTGMGKTVIMAVIMRSIADRGRSALVLVHRRELITQTSHKLDLAGVEHGIIAAGIPGANAPIQVASVQTLARRLDSITASPDLILIDEAHHATAGSWGRVLSHWPDALRLGVTATPVRLDGRGLSAVFDRLVHGPSVADLIGTSYLCPATIYAPPQQADLTGLSRRAGDYASDQCAERMDRPTVTGDAIDHYQRLAAGQRGIAFCCNVLHAEHVAAAFNAAGITAATLLGSTPTDLRDSTVQQFAAGRIQVLVTVDVVSEGFDIPAASCAILLRPTQSLGLYLQQVGRVLRPAVDKKAAIILDHVGNVHRHGFPDDPRDWTLEDGIRKARGTGQAAPSVRTCPSCFAAFKPAPICPVCGAASTPSARELKQVEGQLVELKKNNDFQLDDKVEVLLRGEWSSGWTVAMQYLGDDSYGLKHKYHRPDQDPLWLQSKYIRHDQRAKRRDQGQARSLPQLLALAKERGYSPAWAYKVHNARSSRA